MSYEAECIKNAKEVRDRLRRPPNCVFDPGINLRPPKPEPAPVVAVKAVEATLSASVVVTELVATKKVSLHDIAMVVSAYYGFKVSDLKSPSHRADVTFARHIVMYLAFKHTKLTTTQVANQLGRSNHSTAIHGRDKIADQLKIYPYLVEKIAIIEGDLFVEDRR